MSSYAQALHRAAQAPPTDAGDPAVGRSKLDAGGRHG
jgi:hypothetical protein